MAQIIASPRISEEPALIRFRRPVGQPAEPAPLAVEPATPAEEPAEAPPEAPAVSLDELRREAEAAGYREGREAGIAAGRAELAEEIESLRALCRAAREALAQGIEGLEDVMIEIAFAAAGKVLGAAAASADGVRAMVREAMREARGKEDLVLRVSPRDHELLCAERALPVAADAKVELLADERVTSGCIIETSGGTLDARLEVQLRRLLDTLTRARRAGEGE